MYIMLVPFPSAPHLNRYLEWDPIFPKRKLSLDSWQGVRVRAGAPDTASGRRRVGSAHLRAGAPVRASVGQRAGRAVAPGPVTRMAP